MNLFKKCQTCSNDYFPRRDKIQISRFCSQKCKMRGIGVMSAEKMREKWKEEPFITAMERSFNKFVIKQDGCWDWRGSKKKKLPYGMMTIRGKEYMAHRVSYMIHIGEIPEGRVVLHKCDNPPCSNPDHLYVGTYQDNQDDKRERGRCKVEKLSVEQVIQIKSLLSEGFSCHEVSRRFKCSPTNICNIKNGKIWKWV